jgi:hypothetical protein
MVDIAPLGASNDRLMRVLWGYRILCPAKKL